MGLYLLSRGPHCESPWTNGQITSGQWRRGSKGTRSYRGRRSKGTTLPPFPFPSPSPSSLTPFILRPPPYSRRRRRCHPPEKRIRRYTFASKFPSDCPYLSPRLQRRSSRFLSLLEIFDGKIWPIVVRFCIVGKSSGGWVAENLIISDTKWYKTCFIITTYKI